MGSFVHAAAKLTCFCPPAFRNPPAPLGTSWAACVAHGCIPAADRSITKRGRPLPANRGVSENGCDLITGMDQVTGPGGIC